MYKIGEEGMVICPYNRYHVVSKLRIQKHIIKCKKNYPDVKLATCFYNYCHRLSPESMLAHYGVCSHKTRVEGARYESGYCTSDSSTEKEPSSNFPDINVKPRFFCTPASSSSSAHISHENFDKLDISDSESEKSLFNTEICDDSGDTDDDLPLPLPKTVSKAFMYVKQTPSKLLSATSVKSSKAKGFGRAKNFLVCKPSKPSRTTEHLCPDLSCLESIPPNIEKSTQLFTKTTSDSSNASIVSSMFDDNSTLKSEEIYIGNGSDEDDISDLISNNFDKCTKL